MEVNLPAAAPPVNCYLYRIHGLTAAYKRSAIRSAKTTPRTTTIAIACISGTSRRSIANRSRRPSPGSLNTFSITMIPPDQPTEADRDHGDSRSGRLDIRASWNLALRLRPPERFDRKGVKILPQGNAFAAAVEDDPSVELASCELSEQLKSAHVFVPDACGGLYLNANQVA